MVQGNVPVKTPEIDTEVLSETFVQKYEYYLKFGGICVILVGFFLNFEIFVWNTVFIWPLSFNNPLVKVGLIGLVNFFFVLIGTYLITENWNFDDGEFRKAITVSVISVYFATLAFGNSISIDQANIIKPLFDNYWTVVTAVIAFYFGSRVLENKSSQNSNK